MCKFAALGYTLRQYSQKVKIYSTWNTPNLTNNLQGIAMFLVIGKFLVYKVPSINIIPYTVFKFWEGFF